MQNNETIAAVVILYHPPAVVVSNIKTYYDCVHKIYVFDNTEGSSTIKESLAAWPKIEFFHDGQNYGIAKILNRAAHRAIGENFTWLLTMDQDTSFPEETIHGYLNCFQACPDKENTALFGTEYTSAEKAGVKSCTAVEVDNLITSGALLNLSLFKKIGDFDEQLFIDSVDHDYCIRARSGGYSILKFPAICVAHQLGREVNRTSVKTFFLVKKKKIIHSPLRCYYMYRNMLYLEKKNKNSGIYLAANLRKIVTGNLKNSFFYGREAWKTARYLALAYRDFKKGKMGKR